MNRKTPKTNSNVLLSKIKICLYVFTLCMIFLPGMQSLATELTSENTTSNEVTTTETTTEKTSKTKKNAGKIVKEKGNKYYQYENGKKAKNKFITIKGKTYYFGKKGVMEKGWLKKAGEYYYFDRKTGVQKKNCTVDGVKIKKNGKAKKTAYSKEKIETMLTAKSIMNKVTKSTDTKSQKLKKVFNWVLKHPYKRYRILARARQQKNWLMTYANDVYKKGNGCCVSEACALAFLAHECGYEDVYVCDDTGHAWVEINGRVYDTLFAEAKSYKSYYNSSYKTARLHRSNKTKI